MTRFEDANSSFTNALESSGTHSPKLLEEAIKIHTSRDLKAVENKIADDYPDHEADAMRVHLALLTAATSDVAKADPKLQASIYRDLAVQNQGIVAAKMKGPDLAGAEMILNGRSDDPSTAKNLIEKVASLDPQNKDLKQLHSIQDDLTTQLKTDEVARGTIGRVDTDAFTTVIAINLDNQWDSAKKGSTKSAAELQQFVDGTVMYQGDEVLAQVYQKLNPHVAEQLKKAAETGQVISFE